MSISEYNDMTPYELNLHVTAYNDRTSQDSKERMTLAYLTAYWGRVKRMPDLKKLLGGEDEKQEQTAEDMLSKVKMLNAAFGGTTEKRVEDGK